MIPLYNEPVNTPFVPNVQKEIELSKAPQKPLYDPGKEKPKFAPPMQKPLVDLQVYQEDKPRADKPKINPAFYAPIPSQGIYTPPQYNHQWPYFLNSVMTNPIVKQYNINTGPFVDYTSINVIKEDSLPSHLVNTSNSLGERINLYNFVRSVFIKHHDGEDINLDGKGNNSLLSYLKFLDLNPYNPASYPDNPYKGLPDNMILYRSCYPIRYDQTSNSVQCSPNSIGMNIRIYRLSHAEYNIKKLSNNNLWDYDVWREVAYYEYIREHIVKQKVCPNFTMLYCYYIAERCNIDFDKVKKLKGGIKQEPKSLTFNQPSGSTNTGQTQTSGTNDTSLGVPDLPVMKVKPDATTINPYMNPQLPANAPLPNLDSYSGRGLVLLTEAPTYNFVSWASRIYKREGNIERMVNTGYHKSEVWMSVLFQLIIGLYVMQLNGIYISDFSIKDNVYVKDLTEHSNIVNYWKYVVNNIEYYVPNHGYLVMIDSNYKDTQDGDYTLIKTRQKNFKIYSNIFADNYYSQDQLKEFCFNNFKKIFNTNTFDSAFSNIGGTKPPSDILTLIGEISNEANRSGADQNIGYYIKTFMTKLLNNRVGTYLSENEIKNIRKNDQSSFKEGQIGVYEVQNDTYQFIIYLGMANDNDAIVLTKEHPTDDKIITKNLPRSSLFNYSIHEPILQNYKPEEANLNEENLLETYYINSS